MEYVYGYIFLEDGRHCPKLTLEKEPLQLASFLVRTRNAYQIVITNKLDEMFMCTLPNSDGYLDRCIDQEFLQRELLPILIPMQLEERTPEDVQVMDWGVNQDVFENVGGETGIRNWINNTFEVSL